MTRPSYHAGSRDAWPLVAPGRPRASRHWRQRGLFRCGGWIERLDIGESLGFRRAREVAADDAVNRFAIGVDLGLHDEVVSPGFSGSPFLSVATAGSLSGASRPGFGKWKIARPDSKSSAVAGLVNGLMSTMNSVP